MVLFFKISKLKRLPSTACYNESQTTTELLTDRSTVTGDEEEDDSEGDVRDFRKRARPKRTPARADDDAANDGVSKDKEGMEFVSDGTYRNKQRVLLFSSRGITSRFRHLMADLRQLIPHHKKVGVCSLFGGITGWGEGKVDRMVKTDESTES